MQSLVQNTLFPLQAAFFWPSSSKRSTDIKAANPRLFFASLAVAELLAWLTRAHGQGHRASIDSFCWNLRTTFQDQFLTLRKSFDILCYMVQCQLKPVCGTVAHKFQLQVLTCNSSLSLRYRWTPKYIRSVCSCGKRFDVNHAMLSIKGGFLHRRHDKVWALLLQDICHRCWGRTTPADRNRKNSK